MKSKFLKPLFLLATMISLFASASWARGGADAGGGTGVEKKNGTFMLLDLYFFNSDFMEEEDPVSTNLRRHFKKFLKGVKRKENQTEVTDLPIFFTESSSGPTESKRSQFQEFHLINERLAIWDRTSPLTAFSIAETIRRTNYSMVFMELPRLPTYYVPVGKKMPYHAQIATVAYYSPQYEVKTFLSAEYYLRMGVYSKAATLVHEALRRLQLESNMQVSEQKLQELTARIMLTDPQQNESLDSKENIINLNQMKALAFAPRYVCDGLKKITSSEKARQIYQQFCLQTFRVDTIDTKFSFHWSEKMHFVLNENFEVIRNDLKSDDERKHWANLLSAIENHYWSIIAEALSPNKPLSLETYFME